MTDDLGILKDKWKDSALSLNEAEKLIALLVDRIDQHNQECIDTCGDKTRCGYAGYKRRCPDCPRDWMIE